MDVSVQPAGMISAVLSLLMLAWAGVPASTPARGFRIYLTEARDPRETSAMECRYVVLSAIGGGKAMMNQEPLANSGMLAERLEQVMATRAEKVVFVRAEPDVPYQDFMRMVDTIAPAVEVIAMVTPNVEARLKCCCTLEILGNPFGDRTRPSSRRSVPPVGTLRN